MPNKANYPPKFNIARPPTIYDYYWMKPVEFLTNTEEVDSKVIYDGDLFNPADVPEGCQLKFHWDSDYDGDKTYYMDTVKVTETPNPDYQSDLIRYNEGQAQFAADHAAWHANVARWNIESDNERIEEEKRQLAILKRKYPEI